VQTDQLGTGHAVLSAESLVGADGGHVLVLYGDMPYVSAATIAALAKTQEDTGAAIAMATVAVPDFQEWRAGFYDFSRVVRNPDGSISRTVEKKDATEAELAITEVNPCYFCFDAAWLWPRLKELKNANAQGEYYLTDVVGMAMREGAKIASVSIDPKEALGVNTREHLELLETL
jgi:bifunctional UDP-N-acetylglucosamine pyrophosphorylase/glucosamine-1-phosphate N-acetyltransferase